MQANLTLSVPPLVLWEIRKKFQAIENTKKNMFLSLLHKKLWLKRQQTLCSMKDIANYLLESDNEIDLRGQPLHERDADSGWEYEEEEFQGSIIIHTP